MKRNKEIDAYLLKIADETYRIRQIFESCNTIEQANNTNRLACAVTMKWYWFSDNISNEYGFGYVCRHIYPTINAAISDMEAFFKEVKNRIGAEKSI